MGNSSFDSNLIDFTMKMNFNAFLFCYFFFTPFFLNLKSYIKPNTSVEPFARAYHASVAFNNYMIVHGGEGILSPQDFKNFNNKPETS